MGYNLKGTRLLSFVLRVKIFAASESAKNATSITPRKNVRKYITRLSTLSESCENNDFIDLATLTCTVYSVTEEQPEIERMKKPETTILFSEPKMY